MPGLRTLDRHVDVERNHGRRIAEPSGHDLLVVLGHRADELGSRGVLEGDRLERQERVDVRAHHRRLDRSRAPDRVTEREDAVVLAVRDGPDRGPFRVARDERDSDGRSGPDLGSARRVAPRRVRGAAPRRARDRREAERTEDAFEPPGERVAPGNQKREADRHHVSPAERAQ